jgi:hypothetical protein
MAAGCDGESSTSNADAMKDPTVVAVPNGDINRDGSISEQGLKNIEARAGKPNLTVVFVRSPLSDAGLVQLGKFKNIRRVEATGSRITQAGVDRLKKEIPEVEVVK